MKKLIIIFIVLMASSHLMNANTSIFDLDETAITEEFSELSKLETKVLNDEGLDYNRALALNYLPEEYSSASAQGFQGSDFSFQWEGFLWGFLCCPVGVFVVALNKNKTKDNKISFWIGVAGNMALSGIQAAASVSYY